MILLAGLAGMAASFFLSVFVIHWLGNVIFSFYGIKLMSYGVAMAVTGLLWAAKGLSLEFVKK